MRTVLKCFASLAILTLGSMQLQAQAPNRPFLRPGVNPQPPVYVTPPRLTSISAGTTIFLPDGGVVTVAGYDRASEGRVEYGAPVLGKVPYLGRGFRNTASGRDTVSSRVSASVRIIDLREEEYRQTGFRSP